MCETSLGNQANTWEVEFFMGCDVQQGPESVSSPKEEIVRQGSETHIFRAVDNLQMSNDVMGY